VRFGNASFQLLSVGKKGAIMEQGDAELQVPAILQDSCEIPGPIFTANVTTFTGLQANTFPVNDSRVKLGASAADGTVSAWTLRAGLWRFTGEVVIEFSGTANTSSLGLADWAMRDPATFSTPIATGGINASPITHRIPINLLFHTPEDGWAFQIDAPVTVAADVLIILARGLMQRVAP
jgi:hypothetical protein